MIKSDSIKNIAIALCNFQAKQKPVKPNAVNPFLKNKYADLHALIENTKANLKENGLSVTQLLNGDGVSTLLIHTSGEYIGSTFKIEPTEGKGTNRAQEQGTAVTYARRYAYAAILGLVTDEDTDGTIVTSQASQEKTSKPPEPVNTKLITPAQRKRLFAISKEVNMPDDILRGILLEFNPVYESTSSILKEDYDLICDAVQVWKPSQPEQDELGFLNVEENDET